MSDDFYRFTLVNGQVVSLEERDDGRWQTEAPDQDESYHASGDLIIKTEREDNAVEMTTYADTNHDGIYQEISENKYPLDSVYPDSSNGNPLSIAPEFYDRDLYRFSLDEQGNVILVEEWDDGQWQREKPDADESYYSHGNSIVKTEQEGRYLETTTYTDEDGDGIYHEESESYQSPNQTSKPIDSLNTIALKPTETQTGSEQQDAFVVSELGKLMIEAFNADQGDQLIFDTGLGLNSPHQLEQHLTSLEYQAGVLALEFGHHCQISITGIEQNQISWDLVTIIS